MMPSRFDLALVVRRVEGVLVRVLGTTVRRGFEPVEFDLRPGDREGTFAIRMLVESERPVDLLTTQLAKLYDVEAVEVRRG
jgi:acetolactate synthase II small subunit